MHNKQLNLIGLMIILLTNSQVSSASEENKDSIKRYFEYQASSNYTHLNWLETNREKISLNLRPIINFSGIPIENRIEKAEYFSYGKLPYVMNNIYLDAFAATRMFNPKLSSSINAHSDYQVELIIDQYELPFSYAADDYWWQKLHDQTDRWLQTPANTSIKLTIKLKSGNKKIKPWMESVKMVLSNCDLNASPQPQTSLNNQNELSKRYLSTVPGQTFLAATNFLVLKTIERLNQQPQLGKVETKFGDEIHLVSHSTNFTKGQVLDLFYNHPATGKAKISSGKVQVVKTVDNQAVAYPISLRGDHITVGDWVEISQAKAFYKPTSTFIATDSCADVSRSDEVASR